MFTQYIDRFLDLLERFVVATERRNAVLEKQSGKATNLAQDVDTAEKQIAENAKESTSTSSASGAATSTRGRGRNRATVAGTDNGSSEEAGDGKAEEATSTGGRRQRVRAGAGATEQPETTPESTNGRRERKRAGTGTENKEPEATKDTPEQADDRAEVENLCQLAGDIDAATEEVKAYFKDKGWNSATDVPSADLEDVLNDLNDIIDKYFD